jgi:hypothetical protein
MAELADVGKALFGDEDSEVVKSGTLAVTRMTGWVAAAGLALTNTEVFGELSSTNKLWGSIAIVAVFAFIASADVIARGLVSAQAQPDIRTLPTPLNVTIPDKPTAEERGWKAVLLRSGAQAPDEIEFWVVKGDKAEWVKGDKVRPT